MGDYVTALRSLGAASSKEYERRRELTRKMKASDAADLEARRVACDCGWNSGDHEPTCAKDRAWTRAYDARYDQLLEGE